MTAADLKSLMYADTIPGFHERPAVRGGDGPHVELDLVGARGSITSWISGRWMADDGLTHLSIGVTVYASPEGIDDRVAELLSGASPHLSMPMERRIGDASWMTVAWPGDATRLFVPGRTLVQVGVGQTNRQVDLSRGILRVSALDAHCEEFVDTLARGLEWAIRQRPDLLARGEATRRRRHWA